MLRNLIPMGQKGSFHATIQSTKERDQLLTLVMLEFNQQVLWQQSAKILQARSVGLHRTNLRHPPPQSCLPLPTLHQMTRMRKGNLLTRLVAKAKVNLPMKDIVHPKVKGSETQSMHGAEKAKDGIISIGVIQNPLDGIILTLNLVSNHLDGTRNRSGRSPRIDLMNLHTTGIAV